MLQTAELELSIESLDELLFCHFCEGEEGFFERNSTALNPDDRTKYCSQGCVVAQLCFGN